MVSRILLCGGVFIILGIAVALSMPAAKPASMPDRFPVLVPADLADSEGKTIADDSETATFANGCFWCTEAVFRQIRGVKTVESGYSGGTVPDPTYEAVTSGRTGHAEAIRIAWDPRVVSYAELLEVFWRSHDPTTPNRQGNDYGTQYRSAIFTHSPRQAELAEKYKRKIDDAKVYSSPVVTIIEPFVAFYPAENYHQDYFEANGKNAYCRAIIRPKLDKLKAVFADRMK